jgi:hypothetical protein
MTYGQQLRGAFTTTCRRRGCFRSEEGRHRSNSTFVFVLAFSACVEGDTKAKTERFLEVWNAGREYECRKRLHYKKRQVKKCSKKHDPHARRKRTRTTDASQQHKKVAVSNVVCLALWEADHYSVFPFVL